MNYNFTILFISSAWCVYCPAPEKSLTKSYDALSESDKQIIKFQTKKMPLESRETEELMEVKAKYKFMTFPTLIVYRGNEYSEDKILYKVSDSATIKQHASDIMKAIIENKDESDRVISAKLAF